MVARHVRDVEAGSSNLPTPTTKAPGQTASLAGGFLVFRVLRYLYVEKARASTVLDGNGPAQRLRHVRCRRYCSGYERPDRWADWRTALFRAHGGLASAGPWLELPPRTMRHTQQWPGWKILFVSGGTEMISSPKKGMLPMGANVRLNKSHDSRPPREEPIVRTTSTLTKTPLTCIETQRVAP